VTDGLRWGVEPICTVLQFAPSTYYAAKCRPPSARALADAVLKPEVLRVFKENFSVYGMEKLWHQLGREGIVVGRDRVARLMRELGIRGVIRGKKKRTTIPADRPGWPADLVKRQFKAPAPNRLWVADLTYVPTRQGFAYTAFVTDVFSRRIVGWAVSTSLRSELALDALKMAIWDRQHDGIEALAGLVHHSDRGVQYLDVRYTERLGQSKAVGSVGSKGDSYDNALAESVNALYKSELIGPGAWASIAEVELATAAWAHWWNHRRLHSACGNVPPAEYEAAWAAATQSPVA
jgi:putative transposase